LNPPTRLSDSIATASTDALTFSALCERLGTPLKNKLDRWCGISDTDRRAVFTVWADRLINGRYVYWNNVESPKNTKIGARELHRTIQQAITGHYDTYGILCEAEDPKANPRKRRLSMDHKVLVLRFAVEPPGLVAYVSGEVAVDAIINNSVSIIDPFPSAIDDIGLAPPGTAHPNRVAIATTGYRRDDAVRKHVLERAQGHCMHCGTPGFELPDGTRYLEAHHIIALANDGPDTVDNVIALCAHHHREAHYGRNAEALEAAFLTKLKQLAN
ncbi:MAG: HNH endonuclease, partial [Castellaniella sp.]|nr:HNH endonuclease [Castellaniella sp.]